MFSLLNCAGLVGAGIRNYVEWEFPLWTSLLLRLNVGPVVRKAFLAFRVALTRQHDGITRFEGHVQMFIFVLATVVFTGIKRTAYWFLASFEVNGSMFSKLLLSYDELSPHDFCSLC